MPLAFRLIGQTAVVTVTKLPAFLADRTGAHAPRLVVLGRIADACQIPTLNLAELLGKRTRERAHLIM